MHITCVLPPYRHQKLWLEDGFNVHICMSFYTVVLGEFKSYENMIVITN